MKLKEGGRRAEQCNALIRVNGIHVFRNMKKKYLKRDDINKRYDI